MLPSYIWHFRGVDQDGPNVVVLGGTHGDELTGIELVRRMLKKLGVLQHPAGEYARDDLIGNLFIGFGNPEAILRDTRGASDTNLNRSFSSENLSRSDDNLDLGRARELVPLLGQTDFLFDIHATSSPSEPFVCFERWTSRHEDILELVPVRYVITDPDLKYTKDFGLTELGTTDFYVNTHGGSTWSEEYYGTRQGTAFCYETGQEKDMARMEKAFFTVVELLEYVGVATAPLASLLRENLKKPAKPSALKIYAISECVLAEDENFTYVAGMNRGWRQVKRGEKIGEYKDNTPVCIPREGMLVFPKSPEKIVRGKNVFCIAEKIETIKR